VFSGEFKRSSRFGLIGVFVVAALVVVIALSTGEGQSNPKLTYALIFGVLAVFVIVLFALQRSDMERVARAGARGTERAVAESGQQIENPTTMEEPQLWAALAVKPIDREAIQARSQIWDAGRRSLRLGMIVTLLIFLTVPPIYILESFVPLLIGGPLIAIAAIYGSVRALAPGGEMDSGYEKVGAAIAPLGLAVTERPEVSIEMRDAVTPRMGPKIHGALVLSGERHGRRVSVRLGSGEVKSTSEVTVREPAAEFEAKSGTVEVTSGPEGIVVTRKGGEQSDWLCDLWLAERLASA
jgi:hypothetical protein